MHESRRSKTYNTAGNKFQFQHLLGAKRKNYGKSLKLYENSDGLERFCQQSKTLSECTISSTIRNDSKPIHSHFPMNVCCFKSDEEARKEI